MKIENKTIILTPNEVCKKGDTYYKTDYSRNIEYKNCIFVKGTDKSVCLEYNLCEFRNCLFVDEGLTVIGKLGDFSTCEFGDNSTFISTTCSDDFPIIAIGFEKRIGNLSEVRFNYHQTTYKGVRRIFDKSKNKEDVAKRFKYWSDTSDDKGVIRCRMQNETVVEFLEHSLPVWYPKYRYEKTVMASFTVSVVRLRRR